MQSRTGYSSPEQPKGAQSNPVPRFGFSFSKWGLLGPSKGHLGPPWGHLGDKSFFEDPGFARGPGHRFWTILGSNLGSKVGHFLVTFRVMIWTSFWTLFGALLNKFWGPFLGPDGPKRDEDGL